MARKKTAPGGLLVKEPDPGLADVQKEIDKISWEQVQKHAASMAAAQQTWDEQYIKTASLTSTDLKNKWAATLPEGSASAAATLVPVEDSVAMIVADILDTEIPDIADDVEEDDEDEEEEHEYTCLNCGSHDPCSGCDWCDDCCECHYCSHCESIIPFNSGGHPVEWCGEHSCCTNCCDSVEQEEHIESKKHGISDRPPWVERGITVVYSDVRDARKERAKKNGGIMDPANTKKHMTIKASDDGTPVWTGLWDIDATIDPVQSMADFYLLDGIAGMVFNGFREIRDDTACCTLAAEAQAVQDALVARLDSTFREYVDMAVGGELRYHSAIGGGKVVGTDRYTAWLDWKIVREKVGTDALLDAAALFDEQPGGNIGGPAWAAGARLLHARLVGTLDARTFVDRVFTLQHNGGAFINKIGWQIHNEPGWDINAMKNVIGPAHSASPTMFGPIIAAASPAVQGLLRTWWRTSNRARRALFLDTTSCPTIFDGLMRRAGGRPHDYCVWTRISGMPDTPMWRNWKTDPIRRYSDERNIETITPPAGLLPVQWAWMMVAGFAIEEQRRISPNWRPAMDGGFQQTYKFLLKNQMPKPTNDKFYYKYGWAHSFDTTYVQIAPIVRDQWLQYPDRLPVVTMHDMKMAARLIKNYWYHEQIKWLAAVNVDSFLGIPPAETESEPVAPPDESEVVGVFDQAYSTMTKNGSTTMTFDMKTTNATWSDTYTSMTGKATDLIIIDDVVEPDEPF